MHLVHIKSAFKKNTQLYINGCKIGCKFYKTLIINVNYGVGDKLYLVTEKGNESSFLNEIPDEYTSKSNQLGKINHRQNECVKCHAPMKEDWIVFPKCGNKK